MPETTTTTTQTPSNRRSNNRRRKNKTNQTHHDQSQPQPPLDDESNQPRTRRRSIPSDPHVRIAMYVAMAHAGLALSLAILFGVVKLLQGYWRPIQWAILCSMPLREFHSALVSFWSHSLNLGLFETLIAVPFAALRASTASLIDSHAVFLRIFRNHPKPRRRKKVGFFKLVQWLISFALFLTIYESVGLVPIFAFALACFVAYSLGWRAITNPGFKTTLSAISSARRRGGKKFRNSSSLLRKMSRYITCAILNRLKTTVGIGLIMFMIMGSVFGFLFFSYKIAMEGKDALISLKSHLEENNYAERMGIMKWMDDNHIDELIDSYTVKFYETVSENIDSLAAYYNVTEIVESVRSYLESRSQSPLISTSVPQEEANFQPLSKKLHGIQSKLKNREWKVIYRDVDGVFREFISLIGREDLMEKIKAFLLQSLDVSRQVLASGTMVLAGGVNLIFFMAVSIVSGAAGLLNFISGFMVFLWLLYYLITTDSGGVMDHVLGMLPLSSFTRARCARVLDQAVSSVLLAAAKVTFFQGCLTYLLFRFYRIHFLYTSTFLAIMSAILPITPPWLSSIPAAAQLALEVRYIQAVLLTAIHQILLDYGTIAIQDEIPGQNAYLTGLSILGGIALFPSVLEGAIMGPLLMTVMIALKNLYVEFVLVSADESGH
ncbi:hypothetical protein FEM48_Zijuj04G0021100 [Ziziphus jujuba var. spinosa]|uniref:Transmembrane protein 245-like n=1 Tax=Ziziphus jujuba var. spinosa TaxID=714518 RepID=A0A978VH80_ZIZJJ|nr:uncharacterized protein LOC107415309 [Ziziphus jujuba var. spinosa]KAH7532449.1 hypothetical protein FEM48_Zijuj04G0021100 [Ziziphus jujuba var. spinosa]